MNECRIFRDDTSVAAIPMTLSGANRIDTHLFFDAA